jgi:predicted permease
MIRLASFLYGLVIRLYPAEFRHRYGDEIRHDFLERSRLTGAPSFWIRSTVQTLFSVVRVRGDFRRNAKRDAVSARHKSDRYADKTEESEEVMGGVLRDLRYSLRMLTKNPGFTIAAVFTLALGIGLNAATFSTVQGILMKPLGGVEAPDELVQVYRRWAGLEFGSSSIPHYQSVRDLSGEAFESVAAYSFTPLAMSASGRSERLLGMMVSANFFQTYGVTPILGRAFIPGEEDRGPGAHPVAILEHGFWQSRFGGDADIIGKTIRLSSHTFEIVGVAPPDFKGPVNFAAPPIYVPLMMQMEYAPGRDLINSRGDNSLTVVGRLAEGVSLEKAETVMTGVLALLNTEFPDDYDNQLGNTLVLQSQAGLHPGFKGAQVGMSTVLMVVVALLLLIACVNVANLFLARARSRRREMGIRLSLGAGRGRVVRQLLTESLLFSMMAGLAGLALAHFAVGLLQQYRPPFDGPWSFAIEIDYVVLLFTLVVSVGAGLIFGLAPALQAAKPDTMSALKGDSTDGGGRSKASSVLVVFQMALSLILLISSGLFLRSLQAATEIDPGFTSPGNLVTVSLDPGMQGYERSRSEEFLDQLTERLRAMPDVDAVGYTTTVPLSLSGADRGVSIPGYEFAEGERNSLDYAVVGDGYLEAMGIKFVEGRPFLRQDDAAAPPNIIVNERFADRFWPEQSAIGRVVRTGGEDREVIGVVQTGKYKSLGEDPLEFMYLPQRQVFRTALTLVARTPANPQLVLGRIRETVRSMDVDMPLYDVRTMEDHMGVALLPARLGGAVLGLFGVLGLVLAAVGIYGVMAYSVAQRTRELGIRVALGTDRRRVLRLVVGEGLRLAMIGAVLGLIGAATAARLVSGMLYNVDALDPVAVVGVPVVLFAVATLAVYLPARRAAGVEPMRALKVD